MRTPSEIIALVQQRLTELPVGQSVHVTVQNVLARLKADLEAEDQPVQEAIREMTPDEVEAIAGGKKE